MPKRTDIRTILIIGSGPIVIGQGCEFDYSGTQACKALKAEGYRVVLVNSNPATIMTDPEFSDRTYIEPITPAAVRKILAEQKRIGDPVHAVLPTLGGQTALNCACALWDDGTLAEFGVEMIGADRRVIHRAEDRQAFKEICEGLGLKMPLSKTVTTLEEGREFLKRIGLPAIIRPAFTLGGSGGGIAYNTEEFEEITARGLRASMIGQVQIDQSVLGWKEYELEVVRDKKDNCIIVCGIENFDPMGVHTGDSITVAPILTLTDKEYQAMRDAALAIMRAVGVETGGSNVQFAVNPDPADGRFEMVVVEMNPRVSRSSALASKATGFPIAKIAAKLAVGYTLDELRNDVTGTTSACFEPAIDYVVTKMPRWTFEKFPEADETLTTQMKSVGEAMAIGRTFRESLQKAIRSMEVKRFGLGLDRQDTWLEWRRSTGGGAPKGAGGTPPVAEWPIPEDKLTRKLAVPSQGRLYYIRYAMKMGWSDERIHALSRVDRFFLDQVRGLVEFEDVLCGYGRLGDVPDGVLAEAKRLGYSDAQLANLYLGSISPETILAVRAERTRRGIGPVYKLVDTCAAEFEAATPYYYSTYERGAGKAPGGPAEDEVRVTEKRKVIILGGGPNRIGQGIEFDYCCVHASFAARELGFESVMINSNPETVSTDYDTSDLLFFEPLTLEDVLNVVERLNGDGPSGTPALRAGALALGTPALRAGSGDEEPSAPPSADIRVVSRLLRADPARALRPAGFVGKDPYPTGLFGAAAELVRGERYLPHIHMPGATYFVTWKTMPGVVLSGDERAEALDALTHFDGSRCRAYAACVMSNHVHWIVRPFDGVGLDDLTAGVKRFSARRINGRRGTTGSIWQPERFDHIVRDMAYFNQFVGYLVENPVEAGVVKDASAYRWIYVHPEAAGLELRGQGRGSGSESRGTQGRGTQDQDTGSESRGTQGEGTQARNRLGEPGYPGGGLVHGLIVQYGGQTPLNLARGLVAAGAPIIGTSVDSIDLAEDRDRFDALLTRLGLRKPPSGIARSLEEATAIAGRIGYPVLVRPSYVLGGRGMEICSDEKALRHYMTTAVNVSELDGAPVLIDRFLDDAAELDVDVVADFGGEGIVGSRDHGIGSPTAVVCGVLEHIEQAGIHSGDSACTIPAWSLPADVIEEVKRIARLLAKELKVRGLMNVQMAVKQDGRGGPEGRGHEIFILEVNPRASRTVPFVGKATHTAWASLAAKVMMGRSLAGLGVGEAAALGNGQSGEAGAAYAVKESVFPFAKFPGVDVVLGPEMRSTGEVMGIDASFPLAFAKAQIAAGNALPVRGNVFISVRESDRAAVVEPARTLARLGFGIYATDGTAGMLERHGVACTVLRKIGSGARPNVIDLMADGTIHLVINTPTRTGWQTDEGKIRAATVRLGVPMITTATGAIAAARAIEALRQGGKDGGADGDAWGVRAMQEYREQVVGSRR